MMNVTVAVVLDDGTKVERSAEVNSSGNPRFWSQGVRRGADVAVESIRRMVEAEFGAAVGGGS